MAQEFKVRLGGVEAVFDERRGLYLYSIHDRQMELQICEADLPELVGFISRHNPASQDAIGRSMPPLRSPCRGR